LTANGHTLVTIDFPPKQDGGIARWMDELARGLVVSGRPTTVITRSTGPLVRAHDDLHPATIVRLRGHGWVRQHRTYLGMYAPFLGTHLEGRVVHAATYGVAAPLISAIKKRKSQLVVYVHGLELLEAGDDRATLRKVLRAADRVIANSARVAEMAILAGASEERTHAVAPAIDPRRITPGGSDLRAQWGVEGVPVVLTLARLVERKGQDRVMEALPTIRQMAPGAVYVVAGQGPDRERLEALRASLGLPEDAVRFVGFVEEKDVAAAYRTCDVYAMLARETATDVEGFGITYLEANAAGKTVVAGRSGGVEDAVLDGITGVVVDPEDVIAIGHAIGQLLVDPERRETLGNRGRLRVEAEMSRAAMVKRILDLTA